jgi:hypothetical protein
VARQAPDLHEREIGITPFDCPSDNPIAEQPNWATCLWVMAFHISTCRSSTR